MKSLSNRLSVGLVGLVLVTASGCEATRGAGRTRPGFLPVPLDSTEALEPAASSAAPRTVARSVVPTRARSGASRRRVPTVRGLTFGGEPLDEAFAMLSTVSGAPILVTPAARRVIEDEGLTLDLDLSVALPLPRVLDLMTGLSDQLDHEYRDGVWQIARQDEVLGGRRVSRIFDVRDLVAPRTVFVAPTMTGIPTGEFDEFGRGGGELDETRRPIEPDELVLLVREGLGPANFAPEGPVTLEFLDSGYLLLSGPQRAVERLAGRVRR